MGENRRYGTDLSRSAINEFLTRPRPISLSADELAGQDVTEVADGDEVDAWVRYPEVPVQVRGRVVAYSGDRAVQIEFTQRDGATHRTWVWAGAVTWPTRS